METKKTLQLVTNLTLIITFFLLTALSSASINNDLDFRKYNNQTIVKQYTIYVDLSNDSGTEDGSKDYPFKHIQNGIDSAEQGDSVLVSEGTYNESITMKDRVDIYGGYDSNDWNAPKDCNNNQTIITFEAPIVTIIDANVTIDGFIIQNGWGGNSYGGGIYCASINKTTFTVNISNNIIQDNTIDNNIAYGVGIYCDSYVQPIITGNTIRNNTVSEYVISSVCGTGIYCDGNNCEISQNVVVDNYIYSGFSESWFVRAQGGGIWIGGGIISDNTISRNSIREVGHYSGHFYVKGGAIYCNGPATITQNLVEENKLYCYGHEASSDDTSESHGAGIYAPNSIITKNIVRRNHCHSEGGQVWQGTEDGPNGFAYGGGIYAPGATLTNNIVTNNNAIADGGNGGNRPEYTTKGGDAIARAGGIYAPGAILENNTVANNEIAATAGQGHAVEPNTPIDGNSISEGAGIYADSNTVINSTIIWTNTPDQLFGHNCNNVTYSDISNSICNSGSGNISVDPLFAAPDNNDYHLKSEFGRWDPNTKQWVYDDLTSPCIDAGDPASDWTSELWPHGKRINIGAYGGTSQASMSQSNLGNIADLNNDGIIDFWDFAKLANCWNIEDILLAEDMDRNGLVNINDLAIFVDNWCLTAQQGLIGYWKFDENQGDIANDSSGNQNTALLISDPNWTYGMYNSALKFDGNDDAAQIDTADFDPNKGSISLWAYPQSLSSPPYYLFAHARTTEPCNDLIQLYINDTAGNLNLGLGDSHLAHTNIQALELNSWYHIVLTWENSTYIVYVNGQTKASGNYTGLSELTTFADIGNDGSTVYRNEAFDGIIDEVRIYNYLLSENEVLDLYFDNLEKLADDALTFAKEQLSDTAASISCTQYPCYTNNSYSNWTTTSASSWMSGFFPGSLWQIYESTNDPNFLTWAQDWTAGLESQATTNHTHDLIFTIYNTFGKGYALTDNTAYKDVVLQAAQTVAQYCYKPNIGGIVAGWGPWANSINIDSMMTIEMLFWAAKNGGNPQWYDMAASHAYKAAQNHVRVDGGTYHYVNYDPVTGSVISKATWQGYSTQSTWSRGQAWAIYGFTVAYRETGDPVFRQTAQKVADYYIDNLPEDYVPYWDFNDPAIPNTARDTSAAAIAASGLLKLTALVSSEMDKTCYLNAAQNTMLSLCTKASFNGYLSQNADGTCMSPGILIEGCYQHPDSACRGNVYNESLSFGDYYFIEALILLSKL